MFPKVVCTPLVELGLLKPEEPSTRALGLDWTALWSHIKQHPRERQAAFEVGCAELTRQIKGCRASGSRPR